MGQDATHRTDGTYGWILRGFGMSGGLDPPGLSSRFAASHSFPPAGLLRVTQLPARHPDQR